MFVPSMTRKQFEKELLRIRFEIFNYERKYIFKPNERIITRTNRRKNVCDIKRRKILLNGVTMYAEGFYWDMCPNLWLYMKNIKLKDGQYPLVAVYFQVFFYEDDEDFDELEELPPFYIMNLTFVTRHFMDRARERCPQLANLDDIELFKKIVPQQQTNSSVFRVKDENSSVAIATPHGATITSFERVTDVDEMCCLQTWLYVTFISNDMLSETQLENIEASKRYQEFSEYMNKHHSREKKKKFFLTDRVYSLKQKK